MVVPHSIVDCLIRILLTAIDDGMSHLRHYRVILSTQLIPCCSNWLFVISFTSVSDHDSTDILPTSTLSLLPPFGMKLMLKYKHLLSLLSYIKYISSNSMHDKNNNINVLVVQGGDITFLLFDT